MRAKDDKLFDVIVELQYVFILLIMLNDRSAMTGIVNRIINAMKHSILLTDVNVSARGVVSQTSKMDHLVFQCQTLE